MNDRYIEKQQSLKKIITQWKAKVVKIGSTMRMYYILIPHILFTTVTHSAIKSI